MDYRHVIVYGMWEGRFYNVFERIVTWLFNQRSSCGDARGFRDIYNSSIGANWRNVPRSWRRVYVHMCALLREHVKMKTSGDIPFLSFFFRDDIHEAQDV